MLYLGTFLANNCSNTNVDSHFLPQRNTVWPDDSISTYGTPHSHFLLAKLAMGMPMGFSLRPITHILLKWQYASSQVAVSLINEGNQTQQARVVFKPLTHTLSKRKGFSFIVISLLLQDLNFVRKELKVFMEDSQKWWSGNANFLWETARCFSGRFRKPFPQILNVVRCLHWTSSTTVTFIGICDTSSLPKFGHQTFSCSSLRYFVPAKISPALPLC